MGGAVAAQRPTMDSDVLVDPAAAGIDPDIAMLHELGRLSVQAVERYVRSQRIAGVSWATVGRLLGVTKQSAWRRWRYLDELPVAVCAGGHVRCPVTGAVVGGLELLMVESGGYVPVQALDGGPARVLVELDNLPAVLR